MTDEVAESGAYSFRELVGTVRERRSTKGSAEGINLSGLKGAELNDILVHTDRISSSMSLEYRDWIDKKKALLYDYLGMSDPKIRESLQEAHSVGLGKAVVQEYRLLKKTLKLPVSDLHEEQHLRNIIVGFTFDFYRTLRICQRLDFNPRVAIRIAERAYTFNPNKLLQLRSFEKYSGLPPSIFVHALIHYVRPEEFLDRYVAAINRLLQNPDYANLGRTLILIAAKYEDPEKYIEDYMVRLDAIRSKGEYRDLKGRVINRAASSRNPDRIISQYREKRARLGANPKYAELSESIVDQAALYDDPEAFLDRYTKAVERLLTNPKYNHIRESVIHAAAKSGNPERFIANYEKKFSRLWAKLEYRVLGKDVIRRVALGLSKPEDVLSERLALFHELYTDPESKYRSLGRGVILIALFRHANPTEYLDRFKKRHDQLSSDPKYKHLLSGIITRAILAYADPEIYLDKVVRNISGLEANPKYRKYGRNVIMLAAEREFPEEFIERYIRNLQRLMVQTRYSGLPSSVIDRAALYYARPERYLDSILAGEDEVEIDDDMLIELEQDENQEEELDEE